LNFAQTGSRRSTARKSSSILICGANSWLIFSEKGCRKQGFETREPIAEDWGWVVPVVNKSFRLWIGCGHYQEYEDGFLCFIEPHKPFVWRFLKRLDARERINALREDLDKILAEEEGIKSKRWWTHEAFNSQYVQKPG
jgi:hypothetical protein